MDALKENQTFQAGWALLDSFLHQNRQDMAVESGALKGSRKDRFGEHRLRVLLVRFGGSLSLHETVWRTWQAELADLSVVSLWKQLKRLNG